MATMDEIVAQVTKRLKTEYDKRGATIVRVCGEEHSASSKGGVAATYIAHDNDMCFISDYKFKLILGAHPADAVDPWGPHYSEAIHGTATWKTLRAFQEQYPIGSWNDADGSYGAQCYDYAQYFWMGQVNRKLVSSNNAAGIWDMRTQNAGSEFSLITNWNELRPGDWIIWYGPASTGHVAMAVSYPSSGNIMVWGQNQINPNYETGHSVSKMAISSSYFSGAFRYNGWANSDVTGDNNVENSYYPGTLA